MVFFFFMAKIGSAGDKMCRRQKIHQRPLQKSRPLSISDIQVRSAVPLESHGIYIVYPLAEMPGTDDLKRTAAGKGRDVNIRTSLKPAIFKNAQRRNPVHPECLQHPVRTIAGDIPSLQRFLQEIWIHLFADHLVPIPEKDVVKLYRMTIPYRMEKSGFCRHSPFRYFSQNARFSAVKCACW